MFVYTSITATSERNGQSSCSGKKVVSALWQAFSPTKGRERASETEGISLHETALPVRVRGGRRTANLLVAAVLDLALPLGVIRNEFHKADIDLFAHCCGCSYCAV